MMMRAVAETNAVNLPRPERSGALVFATATYRRPKMLRPNEWAHLEALSRFHPGSQSISSRRYQVVGFLFEPIVDVLDAIHPPVTCSQPPAPFPVDGSTAALRCARWSRFLTHMARCMWRHRVTFWGWGDQEWADCVRSAPKPHVGVNALAIVAYVLAGRDVMWSVPHPRPYPNAVALFGETAELSCERVWEVLHAWGYASSEQTHFRTALGRVFLHQRSAELEKIDSNALHAALAGAPFPRTFEHAIRRALLYLGIISEATAQPYATRAAEALAGIPAPWVALVQRWGATTTQRRRQALSSQLLCIGRWMGQTHPEASTPSAWTRSMTAEFVAATDRATTFQWASAANRARNPQLVGKPLRPSAKASYLTALRVFFRDVQGWGWEKISFDYYRALATPSAIKSLIGPAPRVIDDAIWAKLLTAGLNLRLDEQPRSIKHYPEALIRAVALTWLFGGLRADEIRRLRVGCIRPQSGELQLVGDNMSVPAHTVAFLDVPANKTCGPFSKPIDPVAASAILAWERIRPPQPPWLDRKTGERVELLFTYRGKPIGLSYLNKGLIPTLCRQAGVPAHDARGSISSHRARSTIASQLGNAKEPMSPFELQAWLGHRDVGTTMHYLQPSAARQARAYADADYFKRNVRTVQVLIDQAAILSGAAATGQPWRYFDLGHGWCSYEFFEQCAHRMACARCPFYLPKHSTLEQLVEGKASLIRMRQEIPLTDDEVAAVDEGTVLFDSLIARLRDVPTPTGPTPRDLDRHRRAVGVEIPATVATAFD